MKRLWRETIRQHWKLLLINLGLIAFVSAATGSYPLIINWAFERFEAQDRSALAFVPFIVIAATAIKGGALYAHLALTNFVLSRIITQLQNRLFAGIIQGDLVRIAQNGASSLAQRFTADMQYIREALMKLVTSLIRDLLTCVALVGAMIYLDWVLALVALFILPFAAWPVAVIGQRLRKVARRTQAEMGDMNAYLTETFSGMRIVKTYLLENLVSKKAYDVFESLHHLRVKAANQRARVEPIMEVIGGLTVAGVLILIGWRIESGGATIGEFTGFVSAMLLAAQPMRGLGNLNVIVQEGLAACERIYQLLDEEPSVRNSEHAKQIEIKNTHIYFKNVGFIYPDGTKALEDVSFDLKKGQTIALVGRSGAGKSTIFNLLPRLFDASSGTIFIDNQDIKSVTLHSLRQQISLVSQDVIIFNDSVSANIGFESEHITQDEIVEAAKAAAADGFIHALPDGYHTVLGEGGMRLSGGERQRLSLARAMLRKAPILLLDEPTSALDAHSEQIVQQGLSKLQKECATLVIAHRLATVQYADKILVLDGGRIVEQGTHDALLKMQGHYSKLYKLQFQEV